ncbi:conjugal transfer protein TraG N-terminal domain-containing protein, partial [uncultured Helicobacter sp.]|uniref:conjugal transfer protein TraG N-terminal domain-containing protein n=1 Tax=uncultured Helicobacter sp. TaxID=175537 RepID=UPI00374FC962
MKVKRILFLLGALLVLSSSALSAANVEDDFSGSYFDFDNLPIYVYGDVGLYQKVFNGIAMIYSNQTFMDFALTVISMLAFILFVFRIMYRHNSATGGEVGTDPMSLAIKQFVFLTVVMVFFVSPTFKTTVTIIDQRVMSGTVGTNNVNKTKAQVANIPVALALSASVSSVLGMGLVDLVDSAFSSVDGVRYGDIGFMRNLESVGRDKALRLNALPEGRIFSNMLANYLRGCIFRYASDTDDQNVVNALRVGATSIQALDPAKLMYPDAIDRYIVEEEGVTCTNYYNQLAQYFDTNLANNRKFEKAAMQKLGIQSTATLQKLGETLYANPNNVATANSALTPFLQYQLKASLDETVATAHYADSIGVSGANAAALNANVEAAFRKMVDVTKQGGFLFSAHTLPNVLHIMVAFVYAVFPFVFISAALQGYPNGLKVLSGYILGILFVEFCRMSMALAHDIVTYYTAMDAASVVFGVEADVLTNPNAIDPNTLEHGIAYYEYMAQQAELAANLGVSFAFIGPALIATGKFFQWLMQAASASQA